MTDNIPLTDAAKELSISWERAWRALLNGQLEGEKTNGRWHVTLCSVRRYGSKDDAEKIARGASGR